MERSPAETLTNLIMAGHLPGPVMKIVGGAVTPGSITFHLLSPVTGGSASAGPRTAMDRILAFRHLPETLRRPLTSRPTGYGTAGA